MKGRVNIGYRLFNNEFYAKNVKSGEIVGSFDCISQKVSEFLYAPGSNNTSGFVCKREAFLKLTKGQIGKQLFDRIKNKYLIEIRKPVYEHRLFQSREMKLQADYVGLNAFGANMTGDTDAKFDHFKKS